MGVPFGSPGSLWQAYSVYRYRHESPGETLRETGRSRGAAQGAYCFPRIIDGAKVTG